MPNKFDYRFPNGIFVFWIFSIPALLLFGIATWQVREILLGQNLTTVSLSSLIGSVTMGIFAITIGVVIVNIYPSIRLISSGMEIRFYFPFLTRWVYLPWDEINQIESFLTRADKVRRRKNPETLIVISRKLPLFYHVPGILFGRFPHRGFIIRKGISGYEVLVQRLPKS